jgi:hypothetical protein
MEVALRRRLDGVADIAISQRRQTAEVTFDDGDHPFSPEAFRQAVGEAGVVVVRFNVDACGSVEHDGQQQWLAAGKNRWLVKSDRPIPVSRLLCATGRLNDRAQPPTFEVVDIRSTAN